MSLIELFEDVEEDEDNHINCEIINRIKYLRKFILIHSFLYYKMDESIVSDDFWQNKAEELEKLQKEVSNVNIDFYDEQFFDWNGSSGYHLTYDEPIINMAVYLLRLHNNKEQN